MTTPITATDIKELEGCMSKLNAGGQKFAASLVRHFNGKGLTCRQEPYVRTLIDQAKNPPKPVSKKVQGDMTKLYNFFHQARKHLRFPKVLLSANVGGDGVEAVKLHMSGQKSKKPDMVNITLPDRPGRYGRDTWLGRIDAAGNWEIPTQFGNDTETIPLVKSLLGQLGKDPHKVAAAHGKLTGNCCFCNRHLDDERSTGAGYGPVCADKWGLTKEWKAGAGVDSVKKPGRTRKVTTGRASK
jgi:Family of unknown function (DUF6011)